VAAKREGSRLAAKAPVPQRVDNYELGTGRANIKKRHREKKVR